MFRQGDWVKITDGSMKGGYAKVMAVNLDKTLRVLPYDEKREPGAVVTLSETILSPLPAYVISAQELQEFARGHLLYRDIAERIFPIFNVKCEETYELQAEDIVEALRSINEHKEMLQRFKEWFWFLTNVIYENLKIEERYSKDDFSDAPTTKQELFSTVYNLTESMYWKLEERLLYREDSERYVVRFEGAGFSDNAAINTTELEEAAYKTVCEDISSRVRTYFYNQERPKEEWIYCASQKKHIINSYNNEEELLKAKKEDQKLYKQCVSDLYNLKDVQAMKILAWSYFDGESIYRQSYNQAEKYLTVLYNTTGDPQAANALGYIYYKGLSSKGVQYEKAFQFFSYGALAGLDDCIYSAGEMLIYGIGTVKNIDTGMNLLVEGYRDALYRFNDGEYDNRLSDYALRMGNVCMEQLIFGMGNRDAFKFLLEAEFALKKRRSMGKFFGDEELDAKIRKSIAKLREVYSPDPERSILKADFPLYITQLFEDRLPIRVTVEKDDKGYTLKMKRFRLFAGEEPKILVSIPELTYVDLVSELKYRLEGVGVVKLPERGNSFLVDGFNKNDHTGALEFYSAGECVAAIEAKWYVIDVTKEKKHHKS